MSELGIAIARINDHEKAFGIRQDIPVPRCQKEALMDVDKTAKTIFKRAI
jgi:hypothetical protein